MDSLTEFYCSPTTMISTRGAMTRARQKGGCSLNPSSGDTVADVWRTDYTGRERMIKKISEIPSNSPILHFKSMHYSAVLITENCMVITSPTVDLPASDKENSTPNDEKNRDDTKDALSLLMVKCS